MVAMKSDNNNNNNNNNNNLNINDENFNVNSMGMANMGRQRTEDSRVTLFDKKLKCEVGKFMSGLHDKEGRRNSKEYTIANVYRFLKVLFVKSLESHCVVQT